MSEQETLYDLSAIAAAELKHLLTNDTSLLPEWKNAIATLFESGIPTHLDALQQLIMEDDNVKTETTQG